MLMSVCVPVCVSVDITKKNWPMDCHRFISGWFFFLVFYFVDIFIDVFFSTTTTTINHGSQIKDFNPMMICRWKMKIKKKFQTNTRSSKMKKKHSHHSHLP